MVQLSVVRHLMASLLLLIPLMAGIAQPVQAQSAAQQGVALKGSLIPRAGLLGGSTGFCSCDDRWYTVGLRPGKVRMTSTLTHCGDRLSATCAIMVFVTRGNDELGMMKPACFSSQARCNHRESVSFTVKQQGVYYIQVRGGGGNTIFYTLQIQGRVYQLHCRKYCS